MDNLIQIIESILFVAGEPVAFADIAEKLQLPEEEIARAVEFLKFQKENDSSGILLQIFNNKAQLCSNPQFAQKVAEVLNPIKEKSLTRAVLEAAAIIAYKQPITRLEVEQVRGVNSDYAINALIESNLIEIVGRKDAVGKPLLYGTTDEFLKRFNLTDIKELPDYNELLQRIKVIHTGENSLYDYTDFSSQKQPENLPAEIVAEPEIEVTDDEINEIAKDNDNTEKINDIDDNENIEEINDLINDFKNIVNKTDDNTVSDGTYTNLTANTIYQNDEIITKIDLEILNIEKDADESDDTNETTNYIKMLKEVIGESDENLGS